MSNHEWVRERMIFAAAGLLSPGDRGLNEEYERGMVELIMDTTGLVTEDADCEREFLSNKIWVNVK